MERSSERPRKERSHSPRPIGGYRRVSTRQICLAWCAYREGALARYFDFRVYWVLHELDERRGFAQRLPGNNDPTSPRSDRGLAAVEHEAARLLGGVSVQHVLGAMGRLMRAKLIRVEAGELAFADTLERLPETVRSASESMLQRIDPRPRVRERMVPIPRRILRYLAREPSPALAATVFGHALRCLWMDRTEWRGVGICSSAHISDMFGISLRSAKRERARLLRIGWLQRSTDKRCAGDQRPWFQVNLNWVDSPGGQPTAPRSAARGRGVGAGIRRSSARTPRATGPTHKSVARSPRYQRMEPTPDPRQMPTPLSPRPRPHLMCINNPSFKTKYGTSSEVRTPSTGGGPVVGLSGKEPGQPNLRRVTQRDLESAIRLDALHAQAAKARLVSSGSAGRLLVHSAAARALRVGTQNSCGLFVAIVRRGLWRHISQQDEDLALQRLAARTWNGEASARGSAGFRTGRSTGAGAAGPSSNAQDDLAMAVWNLLEQVTSSRPVDRAPTPTTHAVSGPPSHQRGVG